MFIYIYIKLLFSKSTSLGHFSLMPLSFTSLGFGKLQTVAVDSDCFANGYFSTGTGSPALTKVSSETYCFSCPAWRKKKNPLLKVENLRFLFKAEIPIEIFLMLIAGDRGVWINM